ncbi:MAG: hypothetical protein D3924_14395, partial [Candidatus Electrothrix sp. AR4]|nr:hypothetical protein [Candidatus Electrothrix sp. AR4]
MKAGILSGILFAVALNLWLFGGIVHAAPVATQTLTLHPGWNSVFLEVQPEEKSPGAVFSALPDESSVWTWHQRHSKIEYIQNPNEGLWNQPGWLAYYKSNTKVFLSSLYAILAHRPYLIFIAGTSDVIIQVTGVPSLKKIQWDADGFNLTGFSVAPVGSTQITFEQYFSVSPAHAGKAVYSLNSAGQWKLITSPATAYIQPGKAYWVYCEGASTYQGQLDITLSVNTGIDFGKGVVQQKVTIRNHAAVTKEVSFLHLSPDVALTYKYYDEAAEKFLYPPIADMPALSLAAGEKKTVTLCVRREDVPDGEAASILVIQDNAGNTIQVPVWVDRVITATARAGTAGVALASSPPTGMT